MSNRKYILVKEQLINENSYGFIIIRYTNIFIYLLGIPGYLYIYLLLLGIPEKFTHFFMAQD